MFSASNVEMRVSVVSDISDDVKGVSRRKFLALASLSAATAAAALFGKRSIVGETRPYGPDSLPGPGSIFEPRDRSRPVS